MATGTELTAAIVVTGIVVIMWVLFEIRRDLQRVSRQLATLTDACQTYLEYRRNVDGRMLEKPRGG